MLNDPEARRRLREEKATQRQRKQAQNRKLLIRLPIAAVVLIACGILIFSISRKEPEPGISATQGTTATQNTSASIGGTTGTEESLPPTTTIHYVAVGDLNINDRTVASGGSSYVYTDTFKDIAPLLADADISSVNFEGTLYDAPYGDTFSAPQSMAEALQKAGVDLVQMANSYSINKGLSGLATSIDSIRAAGMEPLGVYPTNKAFQEGKGYTIRTVNGIKLAFVAFTKGMGGMALPAGSEDCVNVLYTDYDSAYQNVNKAKITSILSAVSKEKPDLVIALLHWGSEFNNAISASQKEIVSLMQANGVDAIIGTHSHYVQKMTYDEETGKFVAYSLGDFLSDGVRSGTEYSVALDLEITRDNATGKTKITGFSYVPIFTEHEEGKPLRIMRIQEAIAAYENNFIQKVSKETYEAMVYALKRITARVAGE